MAVLRLGLGQLPLQFHHLVKKVEDKALCHRSIIMNQKQKMLVSMNHTDQGVSIIINFIIKESSPGRMTMRPVMVA